MSRPAFLACLSSLAFVLSAFAQPPAGIQRSMAAAREHLAANHPAEAVAVLEAELLNANGDAAFLALLREAYTADLRDLAARNANVNAIDSIRRRLQALDAKRSTPAADLGPAPVDVASEVIAKSSRPAAPPIPEAPSDPLPPLPPGAAASIAAPSTVADSDPFQQPVRQPALTPNILAKASEAFAACRYAEAATLYAEADRGHQALTAEQRDQWAYCRLHGVAMRLNKTTDADPELAREVADAMKAGSEHVTTFGNQLLGEIRKRKPAATAVTSTDGWQMVETTNFRVLHHGQATIANEIGQTAEAARRAMYDRWSGGTPLDWSPRCDIWLHATGADYAKATGKPADLPGHSTVGIKGARVMSRRIDLRLDEPTTTDRVVPTEVTQVVLADLFADQPLPRWAVVGMAALAEPPEGVARYLRAVPGLYQEHKLFAVGPFLDQAGFPSPASTTAFYAESVSLVSYLVSLKGPRAFATFLREAPRRGFGRALASHYDIKDAADLQDRWLRHTLGGQ